MVDPQPIPATLGHLAPRRAEAQKNCSVARRRLSHIFGPSHQETIAPESLQRSTLSPKRHLTWVVLASTVPILFASQVTLATLTVTLVITDPTTSSGIPTFGVASEGLAATGPSLTSNAPDFLDSRLRMSHMVAPNPVPEPPTYIAGILLVLPIGTALIRSLRRSRMQSRA